MEDCLLRRLDFFGKVFEHTYFVHGDLPSEHFKLFYALLLGQAFLAHVSHEAAWLAFLSCFEQPFV